jgi:hypothetical protein
MLTDETFTTGWIWSAFTVVKSFACLSFFSQWFDSYTSLVYAL